MGLKTNSFWSSWIITGAIFGAILSIVQIISGYICGFEYFYNVPFFINFLLFFLLSMGMVFLSLMLSTLLSTQRTAYSASFVFLLVGFIIQGILGQNVILSIIFYPTYPSFYNLLIYFIFCLYPPFNFTSLFSNIAYIASAHPGANMWIKGKTYFWSDLLKARPKTQLAGVDITPGVPIYSLIWQIIN